MFFSLNMATPKARILSLPLFRVTVATGVEEEVVEEAVEEAEVAVEAEEEGEEDLVVLVLVEVVMILLLFQWA